MKILLTLCLILLFSYNSFSRDVIVQENENVKINESILFNSIPKAESDTLYPPAVGMDCLKSAQDIEMLTLSQVDWVFGCNQYGDQEGAQIFDIGDKEYELTGLICWIQKMGKAGTAYAYVYEVDSATNQPAKLLGTSDPLENSSMPIDPTLIRMTHIPFSETVTITGKFAVSVKWFCELQQGSAMGLGSSKNGCVRTNAKNSWIKDADGTWFSSQKYTNGGQPLLTDLMLLPVVTQVNSIEENNENNISISPMPANDYVTIKSNSAYNFVKIYDLNSRLVFESEIENELNISLENFSPAVYLVQLYNTRTGLSESKLITVVK